ncbi:hypothetical protein L2737_11770 [Shewanella electrodiphila]|uniref:Uncharacterized protein n=1 Tax=Shewanella electrodiphila TaxID=934143 RepID=A0ABT0KQU4_9GAMM|nr:hypothetical protein [Shewanella electrodiphila]MCL1046004.1 hypothetical protein [Shewanella electrodiphila]
MLEIEYVIDGMSTKMYVDKTHFFKLSDNQWVLAGDLAVRASIIASSGTAASIVTVIEIDPRYHYCDVKLSHNHHFFVTKNPSSALDKNCEIAPTDPLELIPYELANKPSYHPNGEPTGHHSGPWVAARHINHKGEHIFGWGRADDVMCAEDAAVNDLKTKVGGDTLLNRKNVTISHAYIRKYTKKGRLINKMSPCTYCRENYGSALNDKTVGESDLIKPGRDYLPE